MIQVEEALGIHMEPGSFHLGIVIRNLSLDPSVVDPISMLKDNSESTLQFMSELRDRYAKARIDG